MLTDNQKNLIKKAKALSYGYSKFASKVEAQGWCSPKQEETLCNLVNIGSVRKRDWKPYGSSGQRKKLCFKNDISDCEAMSFQKYF